MSGKGPIPPSWWHFWQFAWRIRTISLLNVTAPVDPRGGRTRGTLSLEIPFESACARSIAARSGASIIAAARDTPRLNPVRMPRNHTTAHDETLKREPGDSSRRERYD